MRAIRVLSVVVAVAALVVLVAFVSASPFPGLMLKLRIEELFPATISWDGKTAWKRCESAIAGETSWPPTSGLACEAMHLCANEAPLSEFQKRLLYHKISETPGCPEP
jgi:hypothetical protein